MTITELAAICERNGLPLDSSVHLTIERYAQLLTAWNSKINLISRQDETHILDRHILHSLVLRMPAICNYDFTNKLVADLGTGGGLPGIPLKIVTPSMEMMLIDSIQKKITACSEMITELGLSGIRAVRGRAEELARVPEHHHKYDAIVSRAVAPLNELAEWSKGLLKPGGTLLALKGGALDDEILRTKRLKFIRDIREMPLEMVGYEEFRQEDKKLVTVSFL